MANGWNDNLVLITGILKFITAVLNTRISAQGIFSGWEKTLEIDVGFGCTTVEHHKDHMPSIRISFTNKGTETVCIGYLGLEFYDKPSISDDHPLFIDPTETPFELHPGEKKDVYIVDPQRFFETIKTKAEVKPGMKVYGYAKLTNGKKYVCKTRFTYSELKLAWEEYSKKRIPAA